MDGNGRWASTRGHPRHHGHKRGVETVQKIIKGAPDLGIDMLTLYAFSSDNWKRPPKEVSALMSLMQRYIRSSVASFVKNDVRLVVIGRRDRLPGKFAQEIEHAQNVTAHAKRLTVRVALDYSARDQLINAAHELQNPTRSAISKYLSGTGQVCDVDLLIRTGAEQRLSDFLLWECAYAELYFAKCLWPDFGVENLKEALKEYQARNRRFGGLPEPKRALVAQASVSSQP